MSFKDWNDWIRIAKTRVFGSSSTVVVVQSYLLDFQLAQGHWYRSRGIQPGLELPYGLTMLNKKWTLEEEYNRHIYQFQQVNINSINKILTSYPRPGCWSLKLSSQMTTRKNPLNRWEWNISISPWCSGWEDCSCQLQFSWLRSFSNAEERGNNRDGQPSSSIVFFYHLTCIFNYYWFSILNIL